MDDLWAWKLLQNFIDKKANIMETKKYKIQKIQQRLDEIDEQMNSLNDRFKDKLIKERKKLKKDYFALKSIDQKVNK